MTRLRIQDWTLGKVARVIDGRLQTQAIAINPPTAVITDSRNVDGGELFFALRGERFDGHDFVNAAVDAGVTAVVVDDSSAVADLEVNAIIVDDTLAALSRLGQGLYREAIQQGMHAVAVTGSNGKTTTKEILRCLWANKGRVWATPGNLNNHVGVPLTLCALPADCDHLIVEMGANHGGEIGELIQLAPAAHRIITSIGRAHLEGFGSLAGVRRAKREILNHNSRATTGIVPYSECQALVPEDFAGHVITFGDDAEADIQIISATMATGDGPIGTDIVLNIYGDTYELHLPLVGAYNAQNLAAALATLWSDGLMADATAINDALSDLELPGSRLRVLTVGQFQILDDAYNANPSSMRASFGAYSQWCDSVDDGRARIAVVGDMLELGQMAEREHRRLATWLARHSHLSALAFVGHYGAAMADAAAAGTVDELFTAADLSEVAHWLAARAPARVFLKGSRGNHLERLIDALADHF